MSHQCACDHDPSAWSIAQLKQFLSASGVSFADCLEKADFVDKAKHCLLSGAAPPSTASSSSSSVASQAASGDAAAAASGSFVFDSIKVGPLECNCSLLIDTSTTPAQALLVDPGGDAQDIRDMLAHHKAAFGRDVRVVQILITHGHFDHFLAAAAMKRDHPDAPICLGRADLPLWRALPMQVMMLGMALPSEAQGMPEPDRLLDDGDTLALFNGKCIHTPGHSPGSCCFYFAAQSLLLSGDTLFKLSVGRTDLFGGSATQLTESIQRKLYTLPPATKVVPGHNDTTTIGFEMANNPVVKSKM